MSYDHKQALWSQMPYLSEFEIPEVTKVSATLSKQQSTYASNKDIVFVDGRLKTKQLPVGISVVENKITVHNFSGKLNICHINTVAVACDLQIAVNNSDLVLSEFVFAGNDSQQYQTVWHLGQGSKVRHAQHVVASSGKIMVHTQLEQAANSSYSGWRLNHSGSWLHEYTKSNLHGQNAQAEINSLVLAFSGNNCQTGATFEHIAQNTSSKHNVTMLVDADARGVCFSDVFVAEGAVGTVSDQYNRNIALDDSAEMFSQPRLCINNDQVECNHGATTGALDPVMLHYMQTRGLSINAAQQLLIKGYALSAIAGFPDDSWTSLAFDKLFANWSAKC